jgi:RNA recognition motif-containing protein
MSKLRVDYIGEDTSPRDLKKLFEEFGEVEEVSIHVGGSLVYGLVEMSYEDAEKAMVCLRHRTRIEGWCWRGRRLDVGMANRSRMRFLSPGWKPPKREPW